VSRTDLALSDPVAEQLYRIAQEAVSNAVRHGAADHIRITLSTDLDRFILQVVDNGRGFAGGVLKPGGGVRIMTYRADPIDSELSFVPGPRGGTIVTCAVNL
jgi:two-component system CheB/CheR fusion protein